MPKLTVLMTVYNGEAFIEESINSILAQTFKNFNFLILDNASTDKSLDIIRSYDDSRIEWMALPENIGQIRALNKGLDMIDTPLVARMDADDISLPRRLERQVEFMESHPSVGVCGTFVTAFFGLEETLYEWPCQSQDIKVKLLFECSLAHPSVVMRKTFFDQLDLRYDETLGHSEDWELWQRAARHFDLANIPDFLLRYRLHAARESVRFHHRQKAAAELLDEMSLKILGLENHPLRFIHRDVAFETFNVKNRGFQFILDVEQWFKILENANRSSKAFEQEALIRFLNKRLFTVLTDNAVHWRMGTRILRQKKLYRWVPVIWTMKFFVKILWQLLKNMFYLHGPTQKNRDQ